MNNPLPHYYNVLEGKEIAFFRICKTIKAEFNNEMSTKELWRIHDSLSNQFKQMMLKNPPNPSVFEKDYKNKMKIIEKSFLDLKIELVERMLQSCEFCENQCNANRSEGKSGFCGVPSQSYVSSAFLHYGEEPPLVPSGTIFFSGCTFDCVFCQNWDISTQGKAKYSRSFSNWNKINAEQLAELSLRLEERGAKNINYVGGDPTPNLHTIIKSLRYLDVNIPQLWNSNFYNTINALKILIDVIDIWLPDFKYGNNECAKKYSGINRYWDVITRNFKFIYDNAILSKNEKGNKIRNRDIIIRHLVMPNHFECCTKPILEWISKEIPNVMVNIMGQYRPEYLVRKNYFPEINRRVSINEMAKAFALAEGLGINYKQVS
ncbi:MAG: radical SAM protein [Promethearchaeota archaeon]